MSEIKELQEEEREALNAIYEGDTCFKELSANVYQYKYGEDDAIRSFLLEVEWGDNYPNVSPKINMDTFYNRNLTSHVKSRITDLLMDEAQNWLGCSMTYSLFECLKDKFDEIMDLQEKAIREQISARVLDVEPLEKHVEKLSIGSVNQTNSKLLKKQQLTKAQKRRQWERTDHKGDRPRGWNWVDIVKHLSQAGDKKPSIEN